MLDPLGPPARRSLPLAGQHGGRSAKTCEYRCGSACFHEAPNSSDNEYFGDMIAAAMNRRGFLKAGAAAALVVSTVGLGAQPAEAQMPRRAVAGRGPGEPSTGPLRFTPVPPNNIDDVIVPPGYEYNVIARWGDPVERLAPAFDFDDQSAEAQARQFGYNCDYVSFLPLAGRYRGGVRGLLWVNHEYTNPELMFVDYDPDSMAPEHLEQARIEMMAHGGSVIEIARERDRGRYEMTRVSRYNRRITAETPMMITGPAAGHPLLRTSQDPTGTMVRGMLNNCAGGTTPWGTILSAEENFNQYFGNRAAVTDPTINAWHARYGIGNGLPGRRWDRVDPRFDLAQEPHEPFRFGWIVEIDPYDPDFVPRKRTMLGRMKHEGAATSVASDGRVASYLGDDERFDYAYKFVSDDAVATGSSRRDREHNLGLLDSGTLYVARFNGDSPASEIDGSGELPADGAFDGGGEWVPLVHNDESFVPGWSAAEVLINTRGAADAIGATKMDRPEDFQRNEVNGRVYLALTNNSARRPADVNESNPIALVENGNQVGNKYGHVIELSEAGNDPAATTFTWRVFLVAGNPEDPHTYFAGFDKDQVSPVSCPDNVAFDAMGNLWIATDGAPGTIGVHDAFHIVPTEGPERGHAQTFLTVPNEAEACGPELTPDNETAFCAVQHPGEGSDLAAGTLISTWPDGGVPKPSVVSVWREAPGDKYIGA